MEEKESPVPIPVFGLAQDRRPHVESPLGANSYCDCSLPCYFSVFLLPSDRYRGPRTWSVGSVDGVETRKVNLLG